MKDTEKLKPLWGGILATLYCFDILYWGKTIDFLEGHFMVEFLNKFASLKVISYLPALKAAELASMVVLSATNKTKKNDDLTLGKSFLFVFSGLLLVVLDVYIRNYQTLYILILLLSTIVFSKGILNLFNHLNVNLRDDIYNEINEEFEQTNELMENDISVNIPLKYTYKKIERNGWVNIIAPNRATMILGKPGSGKSYAWVEEFIKQHMMKGFAIINYDFKFPTLSKVAYNYFIKFGYIYQEKYGLDLKDIFKIWNPDDPRYSHRCNLLHPDTLKTEADARDAVYTIFYNIDKKSAQKEDFFQMSAGAIVSAALWFLKIYENGKYCSLPHLIEFIQRSDEKILKILGSYSELKYFTSAFIDALEKGAFEQLSGQTASARIPLGKLATKEMFYVCTDPNNTGIRLNINDPKNVTILMVANNPKTQKTNGPALGLLMSQTAKLINQQGKVPTGYLIDELPTVYVNGLDNLIATGRSNNICVTLSFQDLTQLIRDYGKETAEAIFTTVGNVIAGNVVGETAKKISEIIGKVVQLKKSISVNQDSTSVSYNQQLEYLVPQSKISNLTQGKFVGIVSDTIKQQIKVKAFHGFVSPDKSDLGDIDIPMINPGITDEILKQNQEMISNQIDELIELELKRIINEN